MEWVGSCGYVQEEEREKSEKNNVKTVYFEGMVSQVTTLKTALRDYVLHQYRLWPVQFCSY